MQEIEPDISKIVRTMGKQPIVPIIFLKKYSYFKLNLIYSDHQYRANSKRPTPVFRSLLT